MEYAPPPEDYEISEIERFGEVESVVVPLTDEDWEEIHEAGRIRVEAQEMYGMDTEWEDAAPNTIAVGHFDDLHELECTGIAGEYAFSKYYGLPKPYNSHERLDSGDDGFDYVIRVNGYPITVDVKGTQRESSGILQPTFKDSVADIYVLSIIYDDKVVLKGFQCAAMIESAKVRDAAHWPQAHRYIHPHDLAEMFDPEDVEPVEIENNFEGKK